MMIKTTDKANELKNKIGVEKNINDQIKEKLGIDISQWHFDSDFMAFVTDEHSKKTR